MKREVEREHHRFGVAERIVHKGESPARPQASKCDLLSLKRYQLNAISNSTRGP